MKTVPAFPDYLLEEYLYRHLQLLSTDFLPHAWETQRQIELIGKVEYVLQMGDERQRAQWMKSVGRSLGVQEPIDPWSGRMATNTPEVAPVQTMPKLERLPARYPLELHMIHQRGEDLLNRSARCIAGFLRRTGRSLQELVGVLSDILNREIASLGFPQDAPQVRTVPSSFDLTSGTIGFSLGDGVASNVCVVPALHENQRVVVPFFFAEGKRWHVTMFPFFDRMELYNCGDLGQSSDSVIVTDSLEIAERNNRFMRSESRAPFVWTSWYGGVERLKEVAWEQLQGRRLYYHVLDHSGRSMLEACDVASRVAETIKHRIGQEVTLIVHGVAPEILDGFPSVRSRVPAILQRNEFEIHRSSLRSLSKGNAFEPSTPLFSSTSSRKRRRLFNPIISEGTATLVYGASGVGKSWLALGIGHAAWLGRTMAGEWRGRQRSNVLHVNTHPDWTPTSEKLDSLGAAELGGAVRYPDGWIAQCWQSHREDQGTQMTVLEVLPATLTMSEPLHSNWWSGLAGRLSAIAGQPGILVLDGLKWFDPTQSAPFAGLRPAIWNAMGKGIAVLVVVSTPDRNRKWSSKLRASFSFDSILQVSARDPRDASLIGMSVRVEKGFALPQSHSRTLKLDLSPETGVWRQVYKRRPALEELKLVASCMGSGMKESETAEKLDISLAQVKKRKRELRGLAKLPSEIQNDPKSLSAAQALVAQHIRIRIL